MSIRTLHSALRTSTAQQIQWFNQAVWFVELAEVFLLVVREILVLYCGGVVYSFHAFIKLNITSDLFFPLFG